MVTTVRSKISGTQGALLVNGTEAIVFDNTGILTGVNREAVSKMPVLTAPVSLTGSGSINVHSAIPAWANEIIITVRDASTSGANNPRLRLNGLSTGYSGAGSIGASPSNYTDGFGWPAALASNSTHGRIELTRHSGNIWACSGIIALSTSAAVFIVAGSIDLGAALTSVQLFTADTWDAGTASLIYK